MGDAKKPGLGESNPKFDRARMLRHTTEKGTPFPTSPSQQANIILPWPPLDTWINFLIKQSGPLSGANCRRKQTKLAEVLLIRSANGGVQ
jgi:hypothetical protein